jgi:hypothetical protein
MWGAFSPLVRAVPIHGRPVKVDVEVFPGFFNVSVWGENGEMGFYRLPMLRPNPRGLLVANFVTCSIGFLKKVSTVGSRQALMLSIDVVCRDPSVAASLADSDCASETIIGPPPVDLGSGLGLVDALVDAPLPRRSPRLKLSEAPGHLTILDKAVLAKKRRLDRLGHGRVTKELGLPKEDLLACATEAAAPLPRLDLVQLAEACNVSAAQLDAAVDAV